MADLLQRVVSEIQKLPADQRDAIAARILNDLNDEQAWTERFEATTDEQWDRLAESARREIAANMSKHQFMQSPMCRYYG